jgi:peptidyl-Lys metalloendopeptidase
VWAQAHDLRVSVSTARTAATAQQEVDVTVRYANAGRQALQIGRWYLATPMQDDMFEVLRDGQTVEYLGPHYKRRAPQAEDLVSIAPGRAISRSYRLSELYDMSASGNYTIRFRTDAEHLLPGDHLRGQAAYGQQMDEQVLSNNVALWVEGRRSRLLDEAQDAQRLSRLVSGQALSYANCSSTQQSAISSAFTGAKSYSNAAVTYLNGTPRASSRFTTWFGTYSTTNWNQIKTQFTKIKGAIDTKPVVVDCNCTDSAYAYVYPSRPYKIWVCKAFWSAPTTGTDSKAGTLVHELSHFTIVAGTSDHAYGQTAAKNLAKTNPTKARKNADSHEYFAENTPALQ